ncbi:MAG: S41 family peptidase [Bryobacterales bacterium]|nr:S41 family peptidase [Bryobacterales bacterium]
MRIPIAFAVLAAATILPVSAQMTREQKLADFQQLAAVYAKNYAPYEWKRDALGFDLYQIGPWLERAARSKDDLEFYEVCTEYVASLNDAHDVFVLPSRFSASLGFWVDLYDGRVVIDQISRPTLPLEDYPFRTGDELVSLDGKPVEEWIRANWKYSISANDRSTRRQAAALITDRPQVYIPRAHEIGESASVVIRRQSGDEETYTIPWQKRGTPITVVGPIASPKAASRKAARAGDSDLPAYLQPLAGLYNLRRTRATDATLGIGSRSPVFTARPQGFTQRLGRLSSDTFYSGTFTAGGFRIGYLRIPDYGPPSQALALQQFDTEIAYFKENTDGLILDQMRNPGGSGCYAQALAARVIAEPFRGMGFEIRATANWLAAFAESVALAKEQKADKSIIDMLEARYKDVESAYLANRGRTGPLALCGISLEVEPVKDRSGRYAAYDKPLMVLVDEFSASAGDMFPALIQDHGRGLIAGVRTMGAGGSVAYFDATSYSEGMASVTLSLMNRKWPIDSEGLPAAPYLENIGVKPDLDLDYMTRDNLKSGGKAFVDALAAAMAEHIEARRALQ